MAMTLKRCKAAEILGINQKTLVTTIESQGMNGNDEDRE